MTDCDHVGIGGLLHVYNKQLPLTFNDVEIGERLLGVCGFCGTIVGNSIQWYPEAEAAGVVCFIDWVLRYSEASK